MSISNFQMKSDQIKPSTSFFFTNLRYLLFILIFSFIEISCSYVISAVQYLVQETYINGNEVKQRLTTAAFAGFGVYRASNPSNALIERPIVSVISTRIDEKNKYLETQVESCEEILFVSNATGMDITNQVIAGLLCNLGPGKKPSEL